MSTSKISRSTLPVFFIFCVLTTACVWRLSPPLSETVEPSVQNQTTSIPLPVVVTNTPPAIVEPSSTPPNSEKTSGNPQYILNAALNYASHYMSVEEQIAYTNRSADSLNELVLIVEPNRYQGVFHLKSIAWQDSQLANNYTLETNQVRLPLRQPLPPGGQTSLSISYELNLPSPVPSPYTRPVPFGYTPRQTNLVDWYPFIPPYVSGQGWLAHQPGYFGEHLAYETSDFQVNVRIIDAPASAAPAFTVASSSPASLDSDGYHFQMDNSRNFALSTSHDYLVTSKTFGDVSIYGYAFPIHAAAGQAALDVTANAFALYNELLGDYPHRTLSVVEADFLDGMEYDGMYFLSNGFYNLYNGSPSDYLTAIAAHETAHQWFYGMVGNDQAMDPWLDEALCTYAERLYYERYHPEALDWWWAYRINYYAPRGQVNGSIYSYTYTTEAYRAYRDAVYLNGTVFLEELRTTIGDQSFFAFLKDYVSQNTKKLASTKVFFEILKAHTQFDLSPLTSKYFSTP